MPLVGEKRGRDDDDDPGPLFATGTQTGTGDKNQNEIENEDRTRTEPEYEDLVPASPVFNQAWRSRQNSIKERILAIHLLIQSPGVSDGFVYFWSQPGQVEYYQTVPVLSHEFLAMISTMVTMSLWFSWCTAPGCQRSGVKLGRMDKAQEWYDAKLTWYRSFYERKPVTDYLKRRLTTFFVACPPAWNKVLEVKGTSTTAEARRGTVQPKPSGAPSNRFPTPIQD